MSVKRSQSHPDSPTLRAAESPTSSSDTSSSIPEATLAGQPCDVVLFESYLYKIPPLKKSILMVRKKNYCLHREEFTIGVNWC